ncbi:hypothetical protein [Sphingopyxis sp.]|uniref:hypothetical protein n=1 Tax=Sphingopyxis sp. TaxID=1908224 RepID=UPI003F71EF29
MNSRRASRWSRVALAGTIAGMLLGEMVAGPLAEQRASAAASFSRLSANPDAQMAQGEGAAPCFDCPDSYGVAARLRAARDQRMSDEFRELGAVELDPPAPADPDDGYRYGGRFPDPPPREPKALDTPPAPAAAADETPPNTDALTPPAIY